MTRLIIRVLVILTVTPLLIEGLLRLSDPWQARRYYADLYALVSRLADHDQLRYVLPPGHYLFSNWSATEKQRYARLVPNDEHGPCRVLLIGDSVTWGQGVGDRETWANALTAPDVTIIDAGLIGYESDVIRRIPDLWPDADVVIYLVIPNDVYSTSSLAGLQAQGNPATVPALRLYLETATRTEQVPTTDEWQRFYSDLDALARDARLTFVAFDDPFGRQLAGRYPVQIIPWYTDHISHTDAHPNAAGHAEIAAAMLPIVKQAVAEHCTVLF